MSTRDWFEFLLDFNLLDKHLNEENSNPDACMLIVQFLYHANLTEQLFSAPVVSVQPSQPAQTSNGSSKSQIINDQQPTIELKTKRIKVLRLLAIKAACILKWNLKILEKDVPVAVMSDLLQILLQLTLQNHENKPHNQLDLKTVDNQALFSLQLLHRWCIRTSICSKYPVKTSKTIQVNVPGIINPLQHMKEANENILKTFTSASILDSVEFLEKFLIYITENQQNLKNLLQPTSNCFTNINAESGEHDLIWSNSVNLTMNECELLIKYDLAQHYFYNENYVKCYQLLNTNYELFNKIMTENSSIDTPIRVYCNDYEALLIASKSMLSNLDEQDANLSLKDSYMLINRIEESIIQNFKDIFELLIEDNLKCELTLNYRLNVEKQAITINASNDVIDQICSCNIVRFVYDDQYIYKNYDLNRLNYLSKAILQSKTNKHKAKLNLITFIQLNYKNFNKKCQQELESNSNFSFIKTLNLSSNEQQQQQQQQMDYQDISPSSPVDASDASFSSNASIYEYVHLAAKSVDQILIKHAILNYNQQTQNKSIKNCWPTEFSLASSLDFFQTQQQNTFQNNLNKLNSLNDTDFIHVILAKIKRLKKTRKYDIALKLLKNLEDSVKDNSYLTRFIVNETLLINVKKLINNDNIDNIKNSKFYEQILSNCKTFICSIKNDNEISPDVIKTSLAFILNSNDYRFILNFPDGKKTFPINYGYFELNKKLAKLCFELKNAENQSEKGSFRKAARDLWDCIIEIFVDTIQTKRSLQADQQSSDTHASSSFGAGGGGASSQSTTIVRESHQACLTRESFRKYIELIQSNHVLSVLFSLISTLYNICDTSCNCEITSEYRHLWPSSLTSHMNAINLNYVHEILNLLIKHCLNINPFNSIWLRTIGDVYFSQALFNASFKSYLKFILCETKYFFQQQQTQQIQRICNEKLLKLMIRSCFQMNKHTQVICLNQLLPVVDYTTAFKCFQEKQTYDTMDDMYTCVWDMALIEYLIYINTQRAYLTKKDLAIKICSSVEMNESNPKEIRDKMIEMKRVALFLKLIKYYFL